MSNLRDTKCGRCGCYRIKDEFISNNKMVKSCKKCRDISKRNNDKNKEKNKEKRKAYLKDYYEKNKEKINEVQREYKKDYTIKNREKIKEYNKIKHITDKANNPLRIKFRDMLKHSKSADKNANRNYNETDFINYDFLNELWIKQNGICYYEDCKCILSLEFKTLSNKISIQRLNNELPHIKSNCVFSCYKCNVSRNYKN